MMARRCPKCGSIDVRRSSFRGPEAATLLGVLSPYRCRECRTLFRVVSRKFWMVVGVISVSVVVLGCLFLLEVMVLEGYHQMRFVFDFKG